MRNKGIGHKKNFNQKKLCTNFGRKNELGHILGEKNDLGHILGAFSQKFWSPWRHCCETFASERLAPRDRDTSDPFE
jgi:hypothetical protein